MQLLLEEIESRCHTVFRQLARGEDAPPALRLRLEGLLEAARLVGAADEGALDALISRCYAEAWQRELEADHGPDWRSFYPFPQLPAFALRAPVFPSTGLGGAAQD
jgi:hypothetical protein